MGADTTKKLKKNNSMILIGNLLSNTQIFTVRYLIMYWI